MCWTVICRASFALAVRYGASKIRSALYRYGAPPHLSALAGLLEDEDRKEQRETYIADMAWLIFKTSSPAARKSKVPMYSSLVHDIVSDIRTGREIFEGVRDIFRRRKDAREVRKNGETV